MEANQLVCSAIEHALNQYISYDPEAMQRFALLEGKVIAVEITGLSITLFLFPSADGFMVLTDFDGDADASITGSPMAMVKLAMAEDPRDVLFGGDVTIEGDSRLANQLSHLLAKIDLDWEELLSKAVGDIAAHKLSNQLRDITRWVKRSNQSVHLDSGEYLQEEIHASPSNAELRQFINKVDEARESVDRLAARIQQLRQKTPS